jgi:hypothetical protein
VFRRSDVLSTKIKRLSCRTCTVPENAKASCEGIIHELAEGQGLQSAGIRPPGG